MTELPKTIPTKFDTSKPASVASLIAAFAGKSPADLAGKLVVVYETALNIEILTRDDVRARLEAVVSRSTIARAHTPLDVILLTKPPMDIFAILKSEVAFIVATPSGPVAFGVSAAEITENGIPRNHATQGAILRSTFFKAPNLRTITIARGDTSVVFTRPIDPPTIPKDDTITASPSVEDVVGDVQDILSNVQPFDLGALQKATGGIGDDLVIDYDLKTNAVTYFQK